MSGTSQESKSSGSLQATIWGPGDKEGRCCRKACLINSQCLMETGFAVSGGVLAGGFVGGWVGAETRASSKSSTWFARK